MQSAYMQHIWTIDMSGEEQLVYIGQSGGVNYLCIRLCKLLLQVFYLPNKHTAQQAL